MPEKLGNAILELRTDDRKLRRGLRTAEGGANRLNAVFKTVGATIAAAFSVRAITRFAAGAVRAADTQVQAETQLAAALEVTGQATAGALEEMKRFASELQNITTVGDETALGMLQVATSMGLTAEQSKIAVREAIGVSAAFGIAENSAIRYTAALAQGDTTMLNRYIPTLRTVEDDAERVAKAHDILGGAFEVAVSQAEAGLGAYEQLQNRFGDVNEEIGKFLLPTIGELSRALDGVALGLQEFAATEEGQQAAKDLAEAVGELAESFVEVFEILQELRPLIGLVGVAFEAQLQNLRLFARIIEASTVQLRGAATVLERLGLLAGDAGEAADGLGSDFVGLDKALAEADEEIQRLMDQGLARMKREAEEAADGVGELTGEVKTFADEVNEAGQSALEGFNDELTRVRESLDPVERATNAYNEVINTLGDALRLGKIEQEEFNRLVGLATEELEAAKEATEDFSDEVRSIPTISEDAFKNLPVAVAKEGGEAAEEFGRLMDNVVNDVSRALAQAIISGDVQNAVEGLARSLEAAFADALARAIGGALSGQGTAGFAAALTLGITATLFAAFTKTGPFREVEVEVRSITAQMDALGLILLDLGEESDAASRSLSALSAAETEIFSRLQASIGEVLTQLGVELPQAFERFTFSIKEILEDGVSQGFQVDIDLGAMGGEGAARTRLAGEIERTFETLEEAIGFATREFLRELIDQGVVIDEAVRQLVQGEDVPLSVFQEAVTRVQSLADQALMSLDGVSALEIELRKLPAQLQQLAGELRTLGLSSDQVTRLVGGQLVASMQALRQQITGEQLSVARRREIAQANAELFNAELELQIARLEAERDALLAEAGLTQEQIKLMNSGLAARSAGLQAEARLEGNVIDARSRFVQASAKVFQGELGVMQGFTQAGVGIVRTGLEAVGGFVDVIGTIAPEIAKQVQAIQKVIDALRRIGTIRPGDIRIPGVGGIPAPTPIGRVGGGRGIDDAARAAREELDRLVRSLNELASEAIRNIDELEGAVDSLKLFRDEITLVTQAPAQQLSTVQARLLSAAARFRAGDVSAAADVQRIGRQFAQLVGQTFSPLTAGFQSRQRFLEDLLNQTIRSGEQQLATERDLLESLNDRQADLLQQLVELGELTQEEIDEIRSRGEEQTGATRDVEDRIQEMNRTINKLAKAVERLAQQAARNAA